MEDNTRNEVTPLSEKQTTTNPVTVRERIGEALQTNKIAILAAIIVVFSVNNLDLFLLNQSLLYKMLFIAPGINANSNTRSV